MELLHLRLGGRQTSKEKTPGERIGPTCSWDEVWVPPPFSSACQTLHTSMDDLYPSYTNLTHTDVRSQSSMSGGFCS